MFPETVVMEVPSSASHAKNVDTNHGIVPTTGARSQAKKREPHTRTAKKSRPMLINPLTRLSKKYVLGLSTHDLFATRQTNLVKSHWRKVCMC